MDGYPFNLILAVATASATIFLGFLPTKTIRASFFAREALLAAAGWLLVAMLSPAAIVHYTIFFALLCGGSWWKFRRDNLLSGKMWLSIASGLGISVGVMLILAVTPRAYPPGLSQTAQALLLSSIYLGGSIIGLAYLCYVFSKSISLKTGITHALLQRHVGLLFILTLARAVVLLGSSFFSLKFGLKPPPPNLDLGYLLIGLTVLALPFLAFLAQRATRLQSRTLPTLPLIALMLLAALTEVLARILVH